MFSPWLFSLFLTLKNNGLKNFHAENQFLYSGRQRMQHCVLLADIQKPAVEWINELHLGQNQ